MTLIVSADTRHEDRSSGRAVDAPQLAPAVARAMGGARCRILLDDFTIESIDGAIETLTGIGVAEWQRAGFWSDFVHPDDRAAIADAQRAAREHGDVVARFRLRTDGTYLPMVLCAQTVPGPADRPATLEGYLAVDAAPLVTTLRDVHRRLGAATAEADELSRAVLASFPGYVAAIDASGVVLAANDAWASLHAETGNTAVAAASDVGGNYLIALRDAAAGGRADFVKVHDVVRRALEEGLERARVEYTCELSQRSVVMLVQQLKRATRGIIVAHLDVTERTQSVRALHQARQELMRAAQLAVAGELVGAITHDLRQPLTALQMDVGVAIHLLRQKIPAVPDALGALEDVLADELRVQESLQVLQDLVARREPRREQIALGAIATEVARLVGTEASARHVTLDLQLSPTVATFPGDPTLLREALLSLMLDAVENAATIDDRPPRVTIATRQLEDGRVELSVSHPRRTDSVANNRWGLSVARSVAEIHRAELAVDSDPITGVTVRTLWPTVIEGAMLPS